MPVREKKHRIDLGSYKGKRPVTFTANLKEGAEFVTQAVVDEMVGALKRGAEEYGCKCIFTFMPGHMHVIMFGDGAHSDAYSAMVKFKQYSGYWFSQNLPGVKWQKDFWDHIHRDETDMNNQILYLLNNPVKAGLAKRWWEYPFSGSVGFDWEKVVERFGSEDG